MPTRLCHKCMTRMRPRGHVVWRRRQEQRADRPTPPSAFSATHKLLRPLLSETFCHTSPLPSLPHRPFEGNTPSARSFEKQLKRGSELLTLRPERRHEHPVVERERACPRQFEGEEKIRCDRSAVAIQLVFRHETAPTRTYIGRTCAGRTPIGHRQDTGTTLARQRQGRGTVRSQGSQRHVALPTSGVSDNRVPKGTWPFQQVACQSATRDFAKGGSSTCQSDQTWLQTCGSCLGLWA
jgi:hypothetical protein